MRWPWSTTTSAVVSEQAQLQPQLVVATAATEVERKVIPFPSSRPARTPTLATEELEEYIAVSERLGIDCCTDLVREKLLRCLRNENIHIFNLSQVIVYLDDKLGPDWEWRGMRQKDADHLAGWYVAATENHRRVNFVKEPYRGAIPLPVLLTAEKIQKAVPEVCFYISAPKNNDGDPFLLVTNRWIGNYIIERWDEPGFRER